ncbi:hypothetical protein AB6A40_000807 [Gnathostoma spinigerum]|uniref:Splicing factor Cactin n=1 Tax=Gnathostoma spinigerum TaxID=75299 RepID=A0ABD6EBE4_9BILA
MHEKGEHKKHRHRSRSREKHDSSKRKRENSKCRMDSVSFSDEETNKRLELLRKEKKKQKEMEKKRMKETETPEQKRARRLAKKLRKEEKRKRMEEETLPPEMKYTNSNNPFNDPNLTSQFIWKKKLIAEGKGNLSMKEIEQIGRERTRRNLEEMEELKRNRDAREAAKEDLEMIKRDEERRQNSEWERTEHGFHLQQAKLRSKIRISEGRGKPIDFLARYIEFSDKIRGESNEHKDSESGMMLGIPKNKLNEDEDFDLENPLNYLQDLKMRDYEDLIEDIKVYRTIQGQKNAAWWCDLRLIVQDELIKRSNDIRLSSTRDSIHSSVQSDVMKIFKGKRLKELETLAQNIDKKIKNGDGGTDVTYWESLQSHLKVYMAKERIGEHFRDLLQLKRKKIKEEQLDGIEKLQSKKSVAKKEVEECLFAKPEPKPSCSKVKLKLPFTLEELDAAEEDVKEQKWRLLTDEELKQFTTEMYERGAYSPPYGDEKQAMPGIEILDEKEDIKRRNKMKMDVSDQGKDKLSAVEKEMEAFAKRGMNSDEAVFSVEAPVEAQTFLWSEKYRPRKPRYFNRVHTGFEWNKYNQTHYDMDNPPPKIVQGYRFNIFYPDLLDVTQTPTFTLTACDDPDFAILRFHAGPPYEDIAFKCVNREWEVSHKHGYKCQFANGIFQLWFFFKRYRYRR